MPFKPVIHAGTLMANMSAQPIISALLFAVAMSASAQTAFDIINRPGRLAEEKAAWNPEPTPLDEILSPRPFKTEYAVRKMPTRGYWMDNRYVLAWQGGQKLPPRGQQAHLAVLDTDTGEVFDYKPGFLQCYRDGQVVFDYPERKETELVVDGRRFQGVLDNEVEVPWGSSQPGGRRLQYPVSELECRSKPDKDHERAMGLYGTMPHPSENRLLPQRTFDPLLPEHGHLSRDTAKHIAAKDPLAESELSWIRPDGTSLRLEGISFIYEIGRRTVDHYAPFLGTYVFNGSAIDFTLSPRAIVFGDPKWREYGQTYQIVVFSPQDGAIRKVRKPQWLLQNVQTAAARATRAGLLWFGEMNTPGLYLSRGDEVKQIFDRHVDARLAKVSPNGCRILFMHDNQGKSGSRLSGAFGALFDLSKSADAREYALIDFCAP